MYPSLAAGDDIFVIGDLLNEGDIRACLVGYLIFRTLARYELIK